MSASHQKPQQNTPSTSVSTPNCPNFECDETSASVAAVLRTIESEQALIPPPKPKRIRNRRPSSQKRTSADNVKDKAKIQEEYYKRKYKLLKRTIKALVFKNGALCDEVARLSQRMATVSEERKVLLKRIFHHERLKQKRLQNTQRREALKQAELASLSAATTSTELLQTQKSSEMDTN